MLFTTSAHILKLNGVTIDEADAKQLRQLVRKIHFDYGVAIEKRDRSIRQMGEDIATLQQAVRNADEQRGKADRRHAEALRTISRIKQEKAEAKITKARGKADGKQVKVETSDCHMI